MGREADPGKRREWVDRMARFTRSGLTVFDFCLSEGVSVAAYYAWRRKLALVTRQAQSVAVSRGRHQLTAPGSEGVEMGRAGFLPVRVVSAVSGSHPCSVRDENSPDEVCRIELTNGVVVRVTTHDVYVLGTIISSAAAISSMARTPRAGEDIEC